MSTVLQRVQDSVLRINDKLIRNAALPNIPNWMIENTYLKGKRWSFKDHEFQIAIASDTSSQVVVKKCSQVGISELEIRFILAFLYIKPGLSAIYVLPSRIFAMKFSKSRIDPVIKGSPELSRRLVSGVDGAELKQIGDSFLYVGGANSDSQAISIPADLLVRDEYDFGDETVLGKYSSRLRHAENGGLSRDFSTPTVTGYGIDALYDNSSKADYMCKCEKCGTWQAPDFHKLVRIPGYDGEYSKFTSLDVSRYDIEAAIVACMKCGTDLGPSLSNPKNREWVHKHPGKTVSGYSVSPLDVYAYNHPPRLIDQLKLYPLRSDYENFVIGQTHSDDTTEVNLARVKQTTEGYDETTGEGCSLGIDVGHVLYVTVGKVINGKDNFIAKIVIDTRETNPIEKISEIVKQYGVKNIAIDSNPDLTLVRNLVERFQDVIPVYPCNYVEDSGKDINFVSVNSNGVANIKRTKALDELVSRINSLQCVFTDGPHRATVLEHFKGMKRVRKKNDKGEEVARWVKLNNSDHFFHSTLYCSVAMYLLGIDDQTTKNSYPIIAPTLAEIGLVNQSRSTSDAFRAKEMVDFFGVR
jgi:hypothetical protein